MKRPLAWLAGAIGLAGAYRALTRQPEPLPAPPEDEVDPRAEQLRRRIEEAKPLVEEHEQEAFEAGEQPVDAVDVEAADPDARRRALHERARAAADEMRGSDADG